MKTFRENVSAIDKQVFKELNKILKEKGIEGVEIAGLKLKSNTENGCAPGKTLFCYYDVSGKKYCRCI